MSEENGDRKKRGRLLEKTDKKRVEKESILYENEYR